MQLPQGDIAFSISTYIEPGHQVTVSLEPQLGLDVPIRVDTAVCCIYQFGIWTPSIYVSPNNGNSVEMFPFKKTLRVAISTCFLNMDIRQESPYESNLIKLIMETYLSSGENLLRGILCAPKSKHRKCQRLWCARYLGNQTLAF